MGFYAPYVPIARRREQAKKAMDKLRKKGRTITPVEISGKKIATTFWGKGWCHQIESFSDYDNRLPRGRTFVRNGSVCHLEINPGEVKAIVSGSVLYDVTIGINKLSSEKWKAIKAACTGQIGSLLDLLNGTLNEGVMAVVSDAKTGLFPLNNEVKLHCSCPDWAEMCKHIAAVLYGVGARLDLEPNLLFLLRGVDYEELIDVSSAVLDDSLEKGTHRRISDEDSLSDLFGVDLGDEGTIGRVDVETQEETEIQQEKAATSTECKATVSTPRYYSGLNFKRLRLELGFTQKEMAQTLGVSVPTVSKFEKQGRRKVHFPDDCEQEVNRLWRKMVLGRLGKTNL